MPPLLAVGHARIKCCGKGVQFSPPTMQGLFLAVMLGRMWTGDGGVRWARGAARCPRGPIGSSEPSPAFWTVKFWILSHDNSQQRDLNHCQNI